MPLTSAREIGQLLIGSFPGTTLSQEWRSLAREFDLGGAILFSRNVEAPEQVAELAGEIEALGRTLPAWVSVDQEGGRVARLKEPFTRWPPMAVLGRAGSEALAERFARALARELTAVGITLDYAPVLDIHTNPKNPVIGDRALAERADEVSRLGARDHSRPARRRRRRLRQAFPRARRHVAPTRTSNCRWSNIRPIACARWSSSRSAPPFREQVGFIMTAHVFVPALDEERPATLSPAVVQRILREELGFGGVILSDDLEMKAISSRMPVPVAAVQAIQAGCDGVLVCSGDVETQAATLEALVKAAETGEIRPHAPG